MLKKAQDHNLRLRPHFKTHQSALAGSWYKAAGINSITVSSLDMAVYFANHNWNDITVAFPLNIREMSKVNDLASRIKLNILVESPAHFEALESALGSPAGLFIKIDTGYHRTGIEPENQELISALIGKAAAMDQIRFKGFLTHAGHSYSAASKKEILDIHEQTRSKLVKLKSFYSADYPDITVSVGDTPTMSLADNFDGIDEIRPGNFIYYDLMQKDIGSCDWEDIAVAVACPVVAKHENRNEVIIYGGAVHLSKESLTDTEGLNHFGRVVIMGPAGWGEPLPGCYVKSLSQEHGIVKLTTAYLKNFHIGDLLYIIPVHSCLTVDVIPDMITSEGDVMDGMKTLRSDRYYDRVQ